MSQDPDTLPKLQFLAQRIVFHNLSYFFSLAIYILPLDTTLPLTATYKHYIQGKYFPSLNFCLISYVITFA